MRIAFLGLGWLFLTSGAVAGVLPGGVGPREAVWEMLRGFERRSAPDYLHWMAEDFVFTSDDSGFRLVYPNGMTKRDEAHFVRRLFEGGPGDSLPIAVSVQLSAGPMSVTTAAASRQWQWIVLDHYLVRVALSDGSSFEIGDSRSTLELVWSGEGWRVRRWQEAPRSLTELDSLERRLAEAARAPAAGSDSGHADVPVRLAMRARPMRAVGVLLFDLELPARGGDLEIFDVLGRRVARRNLEGLGAGRHTIALDGSPLGSGVYWARVRQEPATATAKLVWTH